MSSPVSVRFGVAVLCLALSPAVEPAQAQAPRRGPRVDMQMVANALGVECEYCHMPRQVTASGRLRLDVAREMIDMTLELNARVQAAAGKTPANAVRVDCVTCHRGVAIPRQLGDIVLQTVTQQGPESAVKQYRDLRERYYGGQSYDFGEQTLVTVADRLAQTWPEAAVTIADLNLEFFPTSWRSYLARGIAQSRKLATTPDAVASFRKALEIDPGNGVVEGWLAQTEPLAKRVR